MPKVKVFYNLNSEGRKHNWSLGGDGKCEQTREIEGAEIGQFVTVLPNGEAWICLHPTKSVPNIAPLIKNGTPEEARAKHWSHYLFAWDSLYFSRDFERDDDLIHFILHGLKLENKARIDAEKEKAARALDEKVSKYLSGDSSIAKPEIGIEDHRYDLVFAESERRQLLRNEAENKRRADENERAAREKEASDRRAERERLCLERDLLWVEQHGSTHLKKLVAVLKDKKGSWKDLYNEERLFFEMAFLGDDSLYRFDTNAYDDVEPGIPSEKTLDLFEKLGNQFGKGATLELIGQIESESGDFKNCIKVDFPWCSKYVIVSCE